MDDQNIKNAERYLKTLIEGDALLRRHLETLGGISNASQQVNAEFQEYLNTMRQSGAEAKRNADLLDESLISMKTQKQIREDNLRNIRQYLRQLRRQIDMEEMSGHYDSEKMRHMLELETKLEKVQTTYEDIARMEKEALQRQKEAIKNLEQMGRHNLITDKIFGMKESSKGFFKLSQEAGGIGQGIKAWGRGLQSAFSLSNITATMFEKIQESVFETVRQWDDASANFAKTTGYSRDFEENIDESWRNVQKLGVTIQESAAAASELVQNFAAFQGMSHFEQQGLMNFVSTLGELGISNQAAVGTIETLRNAMGHTGPEAERITEEFAKWGGALGGTEKAMTDFLATQGEFASYGREGAEIFLNLSKTARALNMDMQNLTQVATQFDTFEGAAEAAAGLNAVLGANIFNSTQFLNMNLDERILKLREGFRSAGIEWGSLNRGMQQTIANRAGINDLAEAARFFGTTDEEFKRVSDAMAKTREEEQALAEQAKQNQKISDQLKTMMLQLGYSLIPLIQGIRYVLDLLIQLNDYTNGYMLPVFGAMLTMWMVTGAFSKTYAAAMALLGGAQALVGSTGAAAGAGAAAAGKGMEAGGKSASKATPVLLALGVAALGIGAGVWLAAEGLASFAKEAQNLSLATAGNTITFMLAFAGGLTAITMIGLIAGPVVAMVGGAMLILGLGLAAVEGPINSIGDKLFNLFVSLGNPFVGVNSIIIGGGLWVMASGFTALAGSLALIKTRDLEAVADMFQGMGEMAKHASDVKEATGIIQGSIENLQLVGTLSAMVAASLGTMQLQKQNETLRETASILSQIRANADGFSATFSAEAMSPLESFISAEAIAPLESFISTVKDEETVKRVERFSQATRTIMESSINAKKEGGQEVLKQIENLAVSIATGGQNASSGNSIPSSFELIMDDRVVGKIVRKTINGEKGKAMGYGRNEG